MCLRRILLWFIVVFAPWATLIFGAEFNLTGTAHFRVKRGEKFTVKGFYKYCLGSTYCKNCIRQVYLNVFSKSHCLASFGQQGLDCKEHHFSEEIVALNTTATYDIRIEEKLAYECINNRISNSGSLLGTVIIQERRPIINHEIKVNSAEKLFQNDSAVFTVLLSHDVLSRDNASNVSLVWVLPSYAFLSSHVPVTKFTQPYPGEFNFQIDQIPLATSYTINITVLIDPGCTLSPGRHFLSIPIYTMYQQRMSGGESKMFVGSVESVTINFTVEEDTLRGFLMHPLSDEVYFCQEKKSFLTSSCFVSQDGLQWTGIHPRVIMMSGMILNHSGKRIYAVTSNNRCHVVSDDGLIWSCITADDWKRDSSSVDFVPAIVIPKNVKHDIPQSQFVASKSDGKVSYGGSAKGLHKMEGGSWNLVATWSCA